MEFPGLFGPRLVSMDTGVCLGVAAERRLCEVVREVAGDDVARATDLVGKLRDLGALRLDPGAFAEFDNSRARVALRDLLGVDARRFVLTDELVPEASRPALDIWEVADLPLPLPAAREIREAWLNELLWHGLVRRGPGGLALSPRLRLHLWLTGKAPGELPPTSVLWEGMKTLRRRGRWHEAARWAQVMMETCPELGRHPSLLITVALGYAQSQNYNWLSAWFERAEAEGRLKRALGGSVWMARLAAVRWFVELERGEPKPRPRATGEARVWYALVSCWGDIYAGRYRRALRLLEFLQARRSKRIHWLDPLFLAWRAAALYYLEQYKESRECNLQSLGLARKLGWRERELVMLRNFALTRFEMGEIEPALAILKGLARRNMIEHRHAVLSTVFNMEALILNARVRMGTGAWTNRRAQHFGVKSGVMYHVLYFKEGQAVRARRSGLSRISEHLFEEVEQLADRMGHPLASGNAMWNRARMAWCRGDRVAAMALLARAETLFGRMNQVVRLADMKCDRAIILLEEGQGDRADQEIREAAALYGSRPKPREAAILEPLRLELLLRTRPQDLQESDLDLISQDRENTITRTAYMYAVVALGFAILDEELSSRSYGKETLDQANRLLDPFMTGHILDLGQALRNRSRLADELVSYWFKAFPFRKDSG